MIATVLPAGISKLISLITSFSLYLKDTFSKVMSPLIESKYLGFSQLATEGFIAKILSIFFAEALL